MIQRIPSGRRGPLPLAALLLVATSAACAGPRGPNVLLISVDTLRADRVGAYGWPRPTTPHIDALARQGVTFTQAICQNTNTNPSHASILSGLYPRTHGNLDNYFMMIEGVDLLPEVLRRRGYATAAFVSGYTLKEKICRLDQGFDVYDDEFAGRERRGGQTVDRALAWIRARDRATPFFLFVHLFDPHGPYDPPADSGLPEFAPQGPPLPVPLDRIPKYQRLPPGAPDIEVWTDLRLYKARYEAEVAYADAQVGRLLEALQTLELAAGTVVVLTSDHGEALDERTHLLDHGGGIGDEEIRVPLILRLPEARLAGRRYEGQVQSIDIAPTLAALTGSGPMPGAQGVDLVAVAGDQRPAPHPEALVETRVIPYRWRDRPYQLMRTDTLKAVRRVDAKLVAFPGPGRHYFEFYDLAADPGELSDRHATAGERAAPLLAALEAFLRLPARRNPIVDANADSETREILRSLGYVD